MQKFIQLIYGSFRLLVTLVSSIFKLIYRVVLFLWSLSIKFILFIWRIAKRILFYLKRLAKNFASFLWIKREKTGMLFLMIAALITLITSFLPGEHNFEGYMLVQEMSFNYRQILDLEGRSAEQKPFLESIEDIQEIEITGSTPLNSQNTLRGSFANCDDPKLNGEDKELSLTLPSSKSLIYFKSQESSINLNSLVLTNEPDGIKNHTILQLKYPGLINENTLSFCLQKCPDLVDDNHLNERERSRGTLKLELESNKSIELILRNFEASSSGDKITHYADAIQCDFTPGFDGTELQLNSSSPTRFLIKLPILNDESESTQWFPRNIPVSNVEFVKEDPKAEEPISTISKGEVRVGEQVVEITDSQFLIIKGKKGVKKLSFIKVNPESPSGLNLRFAGTSKEIAVGIDKDLPVQKIQSTLLTSWGLSSEAVTILRSFCIGLIGIALPTVLKPSSSSNANS